MAKLILGSVLSPKRSADGSAEIVFYSNGAIAVSDEGKIQAVGDRSSLSKKYSNSDLVDFGDSFILPAFVDLHTHPPQLDIIGSYGHQLMEWLDQFTFPAEKQFAERSHAAKITNRYAEMQISSGITTAVWFGTTSADGTDEMFQIARKKGLRSVIGKVSMDQNAPVFLLQDAKQDRDALEELVETWHEKEPWLKVALTPRFAPTCSSELLKNLADMKSARESLYIQTHLSENHSEIEAAMNCHNNHDSYTAIYADYDLISDRTILAHCIHLSAKEIEILNTNQAVVAHCPTSNLFLGSGLCPLEKFSKSGLGTDIGAGTTTCMWETMRSSYYIAQLRNKSLRPVDIFLNATGEAAAALGFSQLGQLTEGFEADLQVIDWKSHTLLNDRLEQARNSEDYMDLLLAFASNNMTKAVFSRGQRLL